MRHWRLFLTACSALLLMFYALPAGGQETVTVRPEQTDEVLINPGMGFCTFQHFNGDPLFPGLGWQEEGPVEFSDKITTLENRDYPQTSVAYCRWYWDVIEPEKGKYRWDIIDNALLTAHRHGQTLQVRLMPQNRRGTKLPAWYMKEARGFKMEHEGKTVWQPDYRDPKYIKYWGELTRKFAERYDGHPWLESVDLGALGFWGEWHTTGRPGKMPPWEIKKKLIDIYLESFRKTPLLMLIGDVKGMEYATSHGTGWRADCLGDLGLWGPRWCHMFDIYPQRIAPSKATDAWKHAPVVFETCGVYGRWYQKGFDVEYIHREALRWHTSIVNAKSSAIPKELMPSVEKFLKKIGYRLSLRKVAYPAKVRAGTLMPIQMWWVNVGVAPPYRRYQLALQLKKSTETGIIRINTNVTKWLPGDDIIIEDRVWVPDLEPGTYQLRVGLLDPFTGKPVIKLPIKCRNEDGWYVLGNIELASWKLEK